MKNLLKLLSLTGFALLMTGCSSYDYYQVESNFKMSAASDRIPATITKGQGFEANFPRIATIAVKAPDFCVSESQSQRTGTARAETNVMQTTCGVEMAQIESSLAKAGFGVISWKVLQNEMTVSTSHLDAAKKTQSRRYVSDQLTGARCDSGCSGCSLGQTFLHHLWWQQSTNSGRQLYG